MKLKNVLVVALLFFISNSFAQNSVTKIIAKDGIHYLTTTIDYPITGTYLFEGAEPIVDLNSNGTGIYQLHGQPRKDMVWGIECDVNGTPKFIKGFNSAAYTLWYQHTTTSEDDTDNSWKAVPFSIHFNTSKMYIQGERMRDYSSFFDE